MSQIVQPAARTATRDLGQRVREWAPAAVMLVLGVAAWQGLVTALDIQRFLLPKPTEILSSLADNWGFLRGAGLYTFGEAVGGFLIGSLLGMATALVLARWRRLGGALLPYAVAANAIPIIAFAPIFNNWFGLINPVSKAAIAAVLVYFPVMVNTLRGLTSVHPSSIELMRSYAAGEAATFRRVRFPNSLPYLFSGLKVASVLSMIGAVVSQYFGGLRTTSLGLFIKERAALALFADAWAAILVASILGVAFYLVIVLVERSALRWHPSIRGVHTE
ncbi:MAG: ABC transporter permease [Actinomycetota bacterium]